MSSAVPSGSGENSSSSDKGNSSSKRRRRPGPALKACVPCRIQKLRCNKSDNPCAHCQRRGVKCYYENKDESSRPSTAIQRRDYQQQNRIASSSSSTTTSEDDWRQQQSLYTKTSSSASLHDYFAMRSSDLSIPIATSSFVSLPISPNFSDSIKLWFDHLLSFFGNNRQSSQRIVTFLLNSAFTHSHYYWFDMWHLPTIRRAGYSEREREHIHPALVYGMVAVGLRQRQSRRRSYGMGVGETMIPDEVMPPPLGPDDLSEKIKEAAHTFLEQDLASPERDSRSWLDTAKAALMLMQLENELSPRYLYLLGIAASVLRTTNLKQILHAEAEITTANRFQDSPIQNRVTPDVPRSSIEREEAARLALLPLWLGTRTGMAYFNVEINQNRFVPEDMADSYVFAPWSDGQSEESQKKSSDVSTAGTLEREEMSSNLRAKILGLNVMYTNFLVRSLPYDIKYTDPSVLFKKTLHNLDDLEFMFQMMSEVVDWLEPSFFRMMMMRFCTSVCYLHGAIIRRIGFAHCDALRKTIVDKLDGKEDNHNNNTTPRKLEFESSIFRGWCRVQQIYMTEMDLDHIAANGQGHLLQITKFQSDVIRLYWLGTQSFYRGVKKSLQLAGMDHKEDQVAQLLHKTVQDLGMRMRRHDRATNLRLSNYNTVNSHPSSLGHAMATRAMSNGFDSSEDSQDTFFSN
ncbi:hypothetical protein CBS101457_002863 [Exobasidium rhododendri]|nr:hypothetical protein CBS101457_002863 [Exobasidium rhododendri]